MCFQPILQFSGNKKTLPIVTSLKVMMEVGAKTVCDINIFQNFIIEWENYLGTHGFCVRFFLSVQCSCNDLIFNIHSCLYFPRGTCVLLSGNQIIRKLQGIDNKAWYVFNKCLLLRGWMTGTNWDTLFSRGGWGILCFSMKAVFYESISWVVTTGFIRQWINEMQWL